jgi:hypothetical protein
LSTPEEQLGQQETVSQFANRVRAKRPGAYDDAPDGDLVDRYLRKHPAYVDRVALPPDFKLLRTSSGDSKLDDLYESAGREHNVDPNLLLEQGRVESVNFNPKYIYQKGATSPAGAGGVAQFMPGTAPSYGLQVGNGRDDRYDPAKAIPAQARMMRELLDKHGNNYEAALAAYNSGSGLSTQRALVNRQRNSETRKYVDTITGKVKSLPVVLGEDFTPQVKAEVNTASPSIPETNINARRREIRTSKPRGQVVAGENGNTVYDAQGNVIALNARQGHTPLRGEVAEPVVSEIPTPSTQPSLAGQVVTFPAGRSGNMIRHVLQEGETPETVAETYQVDPATVKPASETSQPAPAPVAKSLAGTTVRQLRRRAAPQGNGLTSFAGLQSRPEKSNRALTTFAGLQSAPEPQPFTLPGVRAAEAGRQATQITSPADLNQIDRAMIPSVEYRNQVAGNLKKIYGRMPTASEVDTELQAQKNILDRENQTPEMSKGGAERRASSQILNRMYPAPPTERTQPGTKGYQDLEADLQRMPPEMRSAARAAIRTGGSIASTGASVLDLPAKVDDGWSWLMSQIGIKSGVGNSTGMFSAARDALKEAGSRATATAEEDRQQQADTGQGSTLNDVIEGGLSAYGDISTKYRVMHRLLEAAGVAATTPKVMALVNGIDNADRGTMKTIGGMLDGAIRGRALDAAIGKLGVIKGSLATGVGTGAETYLTTGDPREALKQGAVMAGLGLSPEGIKEDARSMKPVERDVRRAEGLPVDEMLNAAEAQGLNNDVIANQSARRGLSTIGEQMKAKGVDVPAVAPEMPVAENLPSDDAAKSASVPFMITRQMRADLKGRGLTDAELNKLTPQEANYILARPETEESLLGNMRFSDEEVQADRVRQLKEGIAKTQGEIERQKGLLARGSKLTSAEGIAQLEAHVANLQSQLEAEATGAAQSMPEQAQGEISAETPHYSNSQNRRARNTKNGNAGQFKKGFKAEDVAGVVQQDTSTVGAAGGNNGSDDFSRTGTITPTNQREANEPATITAYRYGNAEGDGGVRFSSKNKDYSEQYAIAKGGSLKDVRKTTITPRNPLVVDLPPNEHSSPAAEKKYIEQAKANGNDVVIFRDKENGDEFYAEVRQPSSICATIISSLKTQSALRLPTEMLLRVL